MVRGLSVLGIAISATINAACGDSPIHGPAASVSPTVVPTASWPSAFPTPDSQFGIRAPGAIVAGAPAVVRAVSQGTGNAIGGVSWTVEDPTIARIVGPTVGEAVMIEVLAPGSFRLRGQLGAMERVTVIAGVARSDVARPLDIPDLGIEADGSGPSTYYAPAGVALITNTEAWDVFTTTANPKAPRLPPPVDLAKSSLVVLSARYPEQDPKLPVITAVDPTPPGRVEVVQPSVDVIGAAGQAVDFIVQVLAVEKLPDGAAIHVACDELVHACDVARGPTSR